MRRAAVIGSGPNGLSAGIALARAGWDVTVFEGAARWGGGARSGELTLPGFVHDICSAVHPMAAASPCFEELGLERFGLEWIHPPAPAAHPLDDGTAVMLERSVEATAAGLGEDAGRWRRGFGVEGVGGGGGGAGGGGGGKGGGGWRRVFGPLVEGWPKLRHDVFAPVKARN